MVSRELYVSLKSSKYSNDESKIFSVAMLWKKEVSWNQHDRPAALVAS